MNDWQDLEASQNVCIISIPSVFDPSLAPAGKHTIHAYVAANEPYDIWQGLNKKSEEYKNLKVLLLVRFPLLFLLVLESLDITVGWHIIMLVHQPVCPASVKLIVQVYAC